MLIDNAGWSTPLWTVIAQECVAMGIYVLVTIRHENWFRFPSGNWETLEPTLDLNEARQIFTAFRAERHLHASVEVPEWAYERVGKPHLLMEYVYFLTHGQMLEDRLRSQVQQFSIQHEDPSKFEIVRRVALADVLGCPVQIHEILKDIPLVDDPQRILLSLSDEYIKIEGNYVTGMHWVRSNHLAYILHEMYPNPASTALVLIEAVPKEYIAVLVANALTREGLDQNLFLAGLIEKTMSIEISVLLAFVNGIFEAAERQYFMINRDVFQEMYECGGPLSLFLLSMDSMPIIPTNLLTYIHALSDGEGSIQQLQKIQAKLRNTRRGLDSCRDFLKNIDQRISTEMLLTHPGEVGVLLDWYALCSCSLSVWSVVQDELLAETTKFELPIDTFCHFTQGLYRYNEQAYKQWFSYYKEEILGYLRLHTDCMELTLIENTVSIHFFPEPYSTLNANEQAVSRLKMLRSALPFCERYQAQGIWVMPFGLPKPPLDEMHKDMPAKNLPLGSDVQKNMVWRKCVESSFLPDSYYRYQEAWYKLRQTALLFVHRFSLFIQSNLAKKDFDIEATFEQGRLFIQLEDALKFIPRILSVDEVELIGGMLPQPLRRFATEEVLSKWSSAFRNFFRQIFHFIENRNSNTTIGEQAIHNFLNVIELFPTLHSSFESLFLNTPDYFNASELNSIELAAYKELGSLLEVWIFSPPDMLRGDIIHYIKEKEQEKQQIFTQRLNEIVSFLEQQGVSLLFSPRIHTLYPLAHLLRYFVCAFSIQNPYHLMDDLQVVIRTVAQITDICDIFYLIPLYEGTCFLEGGYQLYSSQVGEMANGQVDQWNLLVPHPIPESVLNELPSIPLQITGKLQVQVGVLSLLGDLQVLTENEERLKTIENASNHFEIELYNRYTKKLREIESIMESSTSKLRVLLATEFSSQYDTSGYMLVLHLLEAVEKACKGNNLHELLRSTKFNYNDFVSALGFLLT